MATILVVEDDQSRQLRYQESLPAHRFLQAITGREGRRLFRTHQHEIDIVVLDGYLAPEDPERNTIQLGTEMRTLGFKGPIIAASSDRRMQSRLVGAGCNYRIEEYKDEVPGLITSILNGLQPIR